MFTEAKMTPYLPAVILLATAGVFYTPMKVLIPIAVLGILSVVLIRKRR